MKKHRPRQIPRGEIDRHRKQLLDAGGNPITKERIEEVFKELYGDMKPLLEKCEWEEKGQLHSCWKINVPAGEGTRAITEYTNDAGAAQINEAIRKMCIDEANEQEKGKAETI